MNEYTISELKHAGKVLIHGRTDEIKEKEGIAPGIVSGGFPLFWTGAALEFNIKASVLSVDLYTDYDVYENWVSVFINGVMSQRIMLPKGKFSLKCFRGMNPEELKNVRIIRENQAFESDKSNLLIALSVNTDGEFLEIADRKIKLEFIGDSITSSEGCIGAKKDMDWLPMFFSATNSYSWFIAQNLNADYRVISQSGWGLAGGWDKDPYCRVPAFYDEICGLQNGQKQKNAGSCNKNDFGAWQPDVVIMNLGTNDFSAFNQPEFEVSPEHAVFLADEIEEEISKKSGVYRKENGKCYFNLKLTEDGDFDACSADYWCRRAVKVLKKLRERNPEAYIIWALGMLGGGLFPLVRRAVTQYKTESGDERIEFVPLTEANDETVGSRCHPGRKNHLEAAEKLTGKILSILG